MGRIAALGEERRIEPLAIAGVEMHPATTEDEVVAEWTRLAADVAVLILTPHAQMALSSRLEERRELLVTVLP
jgi:vacuolar-type H+-ATPase subunit F/Vma7